MQATTARLQEPYRIAPDTWVIPQIVPTGPGEFACINSMVILGAEPVIVDTGCAVNRSQWLEDVSALVDLSDVRWVYLSHGDRDHSGNLDPVLALCPAATLVTTFFGVRYLMADGAPPLERMRWVNDAESFDAGDRVLHAVRPPLWDATGTRGLYDPTTGVYWAADCFAATLTAPVTDAADLELSFWQDSFVHEHRSYAEWLPLVDHARYDRQVRHSENLAPGVIASAHGPVLRGELVSEGYRLLHEISRSGPLPAPGQSVLALMIEGMAAAEAPAQAA